VTTVFTKENSLSFTIASINVSALKTFPAGVSWVNHNYKHTRKGSFVLDFLDQIVKRPGMVDSAN
jgi:hypothetical protein